MKRIIVFFSIAILFIAALAHSPPVVDANTGATVEFLADNLDINNDITIGNEIFLPDYTQVALPLDFSIDGSLTMTVNFAEVSMQSMNYLRGYSPSLEINQDVTMWNLSTLAEYIYQPYRSYENRRHLAKENEFIVMGLSRLDIGEFENMS